MDFVRDYWWLIILVFAFLGCFVTINQGFIGVVTMFGKYQRIMRPGLRIKIPFIEQIYKKISIQNRSVELEFQADSTTRFPASTVRTASWVWWGSWWWSTMSTTWRWARTRWTTRARSRCTHR